MEEDIMILESECYYLEELGYLRENNHFIRFNQALENLIKGYREERDLRIHYENRLDNMERLYVDKDKIKEKIEELRKDREEKGDYIALVTLSQIEVLQEFMEDK